MNSVSVMAKKFFPNGCFFIYKTFGMFSAFNGLMDFWGKSVSSTHHEDKSVPLLDNFFHPTVSVPDNIDARGFRFVDSDTVYEPINKSLFHLQSQIFEQASTLSSMLSGRAEKKSIPVIRSTSSMVLKN